MKGEKKIWWFSSLRVTLNVPVFKEILKDFCRAPRAGCGNDGPWDLNCILPTSQVRGEVPGGLLAPLQTLVKSPLTSWGPYSCHKGGVCRGGSTNKKQDLNSNCGSCAVNSLDGCSYSGVRGDFCLHTPHLPLLPGYLKLLSK